MGEPRFTKGPWKHVRYEHDDYPQDDYSYIVNPEGKEICVMDYCGGDDYNNADLIAAAPELYDMLQKILDEHVIPTYKAQMAQDVIRILKKARGEE